MRMRPSPTLNASLDRIRYHTSFVQDNVCPFLFEINFHHELVQPGSIVETDTTRVLLSPAVWLRLIPRVSCSARQYGWDWYHACLAQPGSMVETDTTRVLLSPAVWLRLIPRVSCSARQYGWDWYHACIAQPGSMVETDTTRVLQSRTYSRHACLRGSKVKTGGFTFLG